MNQIQNQIKMIESIWKWLNQNAIVGGLLFAKQTFALIDSKIKFVIKKKDGSIAKKGALVALIKGKAKIIDGDTIILNHEKIRFTGIDTPELQQTCNKDNQIIYCGIKNLL